MIQLRNPNVLGKLPSRRRLPAVAGEPSVAGAVNPSCGVGRSLAPMISSMVPVQPPWQYGERRASALRSSVSGETASEARRVRRELHASGRNAGDHYAVVRFIMWCSAAAFLTLTPRSTVS